MVVLEGREEFSGSIWKCVVNALASRLWGS